MVFRDIPYCPEYGRHGQLDLHGRADAAGLPVILIIHGGALREFSKERMDGIASFVVAQGWVAASINYRLLPEYPYPAPLLDVLSAIDWVQAGKHPYLARQDLRQISLLGASAGGFLALMAGFLLGNERIRGIISISGPTLSGRYTAAEWPAEYDLRLFQAPLELAGLATPPLLLVHSQNDLLVKPDEAIALSEKVSQLGNTAELYLFDGPGNLHGIWQDEESPSPQLFGHLEERIAMFLDHIC